MLLKPNPARENFQVELLVYSRMHWFVNEYAVLLYPIWSKDGKYVFLPYQLRSDSIGYNDME